MDPWVVPLVNCHYCRWEGKKANLKTEVTSKQSTQNFPKYAHRRVRISENFACFVFLSTFWDSPVCLITDVVFSYHFMRHTILLWPGCYTGLFIQNGFINVINGDSYSFIILRSKDSIFLLGQPDVSWPRSHLFNSFTTEADII